ncbi:MAG TPA: SUF system NifU family Fe-S cluster assembly protein [Caldithrix sp.]|nr:SUF system NifU family Fe-S cluster assembly protein [Caldithrix sp.]
MEFENLYQDIILDHYKHPRNFGEGQPQCTAVELDNPTCGDHIKLMLEVNENGVVKDVKFSGSGCAISVASASMMTEEIIGKSVSEAKAIVKDVLETMRGEKEPNELNEHGDISALKGVIKYPARVKCATLSWHAVQKALNESEKKQNADGK